MVVSFNSKLVRLKEQGIKPEEIAEQTFQFQTGSIKRIRPSWSGLKRVCQFQFQTGSIKRTTMPQ